VNDLTAFIRLHVRSVATVAGLVVLTMVWWLGWMTPTAHETAAAYQTAANDQTTIIALRGQIARLILESERVRHELPYLKRFPAEIPPSPEYGELAVEIQDLEQETGVQVTSLGLPPATTPAGSVVATISLGISVSGGHDDLLAFLGGLTGTGPHAIKRLVTVQSFGLNGGQGDVLASNEASYTASIQATAYTTATSASTSPAGGLG
jgi:hypothetical protein